MSESYFSTRLKKMGITDKENQVMLWRYDVKEQKNILKPEAIFCEHEKGIEILVYTLDREYITIEKDGSRWKNNWSITRLENPIVKENGDTIKYLMPKGNGSYPFFPPGILEKYEAKTSIKTLYITEGFFKAFKGAKHGLDIIGLPSITHIKNKERGELHDDIKRLIQVCKVQRVVWLTDGDCFDLSSKVNDAKADVDIYNRPRSFYNSIATFKDLLDEYEIDKWFMHIDCDSILQDYKTKQRNEIKGIDDILISFPDKIKEIINDINNISRNGIWFKKFNITTSISKVIKEFRFNNVTEFFLWHVERGEISKDKEFIFNGTKYKYDEEKSECVIIVPGEAKHYFRVANQYYKFVHVPNKYKQLEKQYSTREKGTIKDDHGASFIKHIPKFEAFCSVPDHNNFQQVIHSCFNVYNPLDYFPQDEPATDEDCISILNFIKHVFGEKIIEFTHPQNKYKRNISTFDLALDYIQILYQKPAEKLPILCLVSKENNTGKTTFGKLLKQILGSNCAIVGNQDLISDFNKHWATKALVICDETKIDKDTVVERVKNLSTADKIMMNAKGKDHVEIDCFIKFIFITNNENNFIKITDEDIRYWVIKVPVVSEDNPDLINNMIEEIPAFLSFINQRKLVTDKLNRMWFHPDLLKTDALNKVIDNSRPSIEKEIMLHIHDRFIEFKVDELYMTLTDIKEEFFKNKNIDRTYIKQILTQNMHLKTAKLQRYDWPIWELNSFNQEHVIKITKKNPGTPFIFKIEQFLTQDELNEIKEEKINSLKNGTESPTWDD